MHIPFENADNNNELIYAGPFNYIELKDNQYILNGTETLNNFEVDEELIKMNTLLTKESTSNNRSSRSVSSGWIGIDNSNFTLYNSNSWQQHNGTCGQISLSILMAYYQDHITPHTTVPSSVRTQNSTSPGQLISDMLPHLY